MNVTRYLKINSYALAFLQEVVSMFNLILGNSKGSKMYWEDEMKRALQNKYILCLSDFEQSDDFNLKDYLNLKIVFYELLKISGVKLARKLGIV
jgi:hypothetical protein